MKKIKNKNDKIKDKSKTGISQFDFKGLNEIYENNLSLYSNFIKNINVDQKPKENSGKHDFKSQELYQLIAPTTDRIFESLSAFSGKIHKDPKLLFENLHIWMQDIVKLNYYFISKTSNKKVDPIIEPNKADRRFSNKEWSENLFFDFIKQFYLITTTLLENLVEQGKFSDPKQKDYFKFYIKQINTALSPSNFVFTNPEILAKTIKEGGQNLIRGYENYRKDNLKHPNKFYISQTKFDYFEIGKNIATTKGKIITKTIFLN